MYLEKLKERFKNFDNDFLYLGHERDKVAKKTMIILQCKKCGEIIEKEQYNTLNRNITLFCFKCENFKKAKPIDVDNLLNNFELNGCKDIKRIGNKIHGICKCGKQLERNIYNINNNYECVKCSLEKREFANSYKESDVREWFIQNNLIPLFDKYENANKNLKYKCTCGEISYVRYSRRFSNDDNWIPMCKRCAMKLKNSGENHWNWNGGHKYKGGKRWSNKIKKIFNYKCCITGETNNLIAHHLNATNLCLENTHDMRNGVCITNDLHMEFHLKYDRFKGICTREQFKEFFFDKTNLNFEEYIKNNITYESQ